MNGAWSAIAFTVLFTAGWLAPARAGTPIPPSPKYYVLDEPHALTSKENQALSTLLIEHDAATGEQIIIAVFKSLQGEDLAKRTDAIFAAWEVGRRQGGNGALLALYLDDRRARISAGYGMSTRLTDSEAKGAIRDFLLPELKAGHIYRALGLSSLQMLRALESPLIESGRAQEILRAGGLEGSLKPVPRGLNTWFAWLVAGLALFAALVLRLTSAEAHFTSSGWFRPKPWRSAWQAIRDRARARGGSAPGADSLGGADASW